VDGGRRNESRPCETVFRPEVSRIVNLKEAPEWETP
jgi:hypothetical protein